MTEGTAIELAKYKMKELGVGKKYLLRYRHLQLDAGAVREFRSEQDLYILIDGVESIKVESKAGVYDLLDQRVNEQQHIHSGLIRVQNTGNSTGTVRFIQVIPRLKMNN